jgi:hypothetical protein
MIVVDLETWPRVARPAFWRPVVGAALTPATTEVPVEVTERACTGGLAADGRIPRPHIEYGPEEVRVSFSVVALPEGRTCDPNPATPYMLVLGEPLGDRALVGASGPGT